MRTSLILLVGVCAVMIACLIVGGVLGRDHDLEHRSCPQYATYRIQNVPARCLSYFEERSR